MTTHDLRLERLFDASPEAVFDAFVDPAAQRALHGGGRPDWTVHRCETDVSVGGTSVYVMGPQGKDPDTETRVFSVVDRPHRLVFRHSMDVAGWGRTVETEMTITFEDKGDKTLLTMVQTGFEREGDRDDFVGKSGGGWPDYLDSLKAVVSKDLKARHDTDAEKGANDG